MAGWVQRSRKLGGMTFIDLRDRYGITQLVVEADAPAELVDAANSLGREFVIRAVGTVVERASKNPKMPTGDVEIKLETINILNASLTPPFTIEDNSDGGEDLRAKYRYLDLRRNPLQKALQLRHRICHETREYLDAQNFLEIETPFLINSTKQLGQVLFGRLGLPVIKKNKSGPSTDAETLQKLRFRSPIVDKILTYRAYAKLYSTYVLGLLGEIAGDGRIHTVFHQTLTATGRLSSAEPNLQNIPVKTELGREMRKFFIAPPGCVLVDADYSQIELRLLAHISGDETLRGFFRDGKDTREMRKCTNAVNFGIVYGIGEYSLGQDLGIPTYLAKEYIAGYFALFPGVKAYLEDVKEKAKQTGFVTTLFGRRRYIPELTAPKKTLVSFGERVAMNAPIQGTAADIMKLAMVRVDRRLEAENMKSRMILQVHDEIILECPEEEAESAAAILSEEMANAASLDVPLVADAKSGASWFDAK